VTHIYLKILWKVFLTSFCLEFSSETVKPKMHFLVHYGHQCRMFGPLVHSWSFRFEGKHGFFKDLTNRMKCRKNVLLSLAKKHQYYQSWHLHHSCSLLRDCEIGNNAGKQVYVSSLSAHVQCILQPIAASNHTVYHASSVEIDGIKFEPNLSVITAVSNGELSISVICDIFIVNRSVYIVGSALEQITYYRHFHAHVGVLSRNQHY